MVTVTDFRKCTNAKGESFCALVLMGGITFVMSSKSNKYYATAWRGSIPSTFSEEFCKSLIGKTLPGEIEKVECGPYEYKIPSTGETILLTHQYRFNPNPGITSMEQAVFTPELVTAK